jgi:hypothetical protein
MSAAEAVKAEKLYSGKKYKHCHRRHAWKRRGGGRCSVALCARRIATTVSDTAMAACSSLCCRRFEWPVHRTLLAPSCAAALRLKDDLPYRFKNLLTFVLGWLGKPLNNSERLPNSFGFG